MAFKLAGVCGLVLVAAFSACGSDDEKRKVQGDAGEAGDASRAGAPNAGGGEVGGAANEAGNGAGALPGGGGGVDSVAGQPGGGGVPGGGGEPPVSGPVSVNGRVVARNEQPVAGITVEIEGQTLTTDADGRFSIEATAPYDIVVRGDFVGGQYNHELYVGVTRADPKLYRSFVDENRSGGASGTVSGGLGFPQPAGHETRIQFGGPVLATFQNTLAQASDGSYDSSGDPQWLDTSTLAGVLFAIQRETATQTIKAVGSAPFTLTDGETSAGGDVALTAATLRDFTVDVTAPGFTLGACNVFFGPYGVTNNSPKSPVTVQVPNGVPDEVGISVLVSGTHSSGGIGSRTLRLPGNASGAQVTLAAPPVIVGPANGSVLTSGSSFSFTRPAGTVAVVSFDYQEDNGDGFTSYYTTVFTNGSSVARSRLIELELGSPPGAGANWNVSVDHGSTTVDELTAPNRRRFDDVASTSAGAQRQYF